MSAATSIPIPDDLFREVSQQANHAGVSAQEWAANVLAERVRIERQTEEFCRLRAAGASSKSLGELLDKAPDRQPDPGDEFES
jgi:hypothetical protein